MLEVCSADGILAGYMAEALQCWMGQRVLDSGMQVCSGWAALLGLWGCYVSDCIWMLDAAVDWSWVDAWNGIFLLLAMPVVCVGVLGLFVGGCGYLMAAVLTIPGLFVGGCLQLSCVWAGALSSLIPAVLAVCGLLSLL